MIRYLVMDVDGTLTDGKIYMGPEGEAMKAFSIKDGYVINYILKPKNITPIVITARNSSIVQHRCDELGIKDIYQGKLDKLSALIEIVGSDDLGNCAYFGDDILDLKCMKPIKAAGGLVGCPADAVLEVKANSDYICKSKAGEGALREFSEWLVSQRADEKEIEQRVEEAITYIKQLKIEEIEIGKKIVVNENFFFNIQSYETKEKENCKLESHKKYIDIQMMISGKEKMELADVARLTIKEEYNEDADVMYWNTPERISTVILSEGDYIVLYPENAHRGAVKVEKAEQVVKIVGKVKAH